MPVRVIAAFVCCRAGHGVAWVCDECITSKGSATAARRRKQFCGRHLPGSILTLIEALMRIPLAKSTATTKQKIEVTCLGVPESMALFWMF
jgi:hypothetical protein